MLKSLIFEKMSIGLPTKRLHEMTIIVLLPQDLLPVVLLIESILIGESSLHSHYPCQLILGLNSLAHL